MRRDSERGGRGVRFEVVTRGGRWEFGDFGGVRRCGINEFLSSGGLGFLGVNLVQLQMVSTGWDLNGMA